MKLTEEQIKSNAAAVEAHLSGRPVQLAALNRDNPEWVDTVTPGWRFDAVSYRPKPEPRVRPWSKPDDVPGPVCWVRANGAVGAMVVGMTGAGMQCGADPEILTWKEIETAKTEYSTDRREWKKCEVTEP